MNYRYNWIVDQRAILESGLDIDIIDYSILRVLADFASSGNCKTMQMDGCVWYYFNWKIIPQQMPILGIKSRRGVLKRYDKLKVHKLLESHEANQRNNDSWFKFGINYDKLLYKTPVNESTHPVNESSHVPVNNCSHPPVNESTHNKTTNINNTINNINKDSKESQSSKSNKFIKPTLQECKAYCKEKGWKLEFAEEFIDGNEQRGWKLNGGRLMQDWKAAMRTWMRKDYNQKYLLHKETQIENNTSGLITDQIEPPKRQKYINLVSSAVTRYTRHKNVSNSQRTDYSYISGMALIERFKTDHPKLFEECLNEYHQKIIDNL